MEDIESLDFCSSSYFPFANVKNEEYANIENLLSSNQEEDPENSSGPKCNNKSSKKPSCSDPSNVNSDYESEKKIPQHHSHKKKKKKHSDGSAAGNPFMSARQISIQPSASSDHSEKSDEDDVLSGSEDKCKNQCLTQEHEEDVSYKPKSKLPDYYDVDHQKTSDKDSSNKNNEAKATKIKPVFGRPAKKVDHVSKKLKKPKGDSLDLKPDIKNKKKSSSSEISLDDPKSLSDQSHCIITEEDEDSFCLSAKVCSSKKKNEEEEQIVPNFSVKKSKSKHLKKSPLKEMNLPVGPKDIKNSGTEKHKKRSLIEISSSILNSDHHHKKDSNSNPPSEKKSKEKKKKTKNSTEKSDICPIETTDEVCNIPKKKRKKAVDTSSFAGLDEDENDGPVITNVRSLVDNFDQDLKNIECPSQNDVEPAAESSTSIDKSDDHQEHKKKKRKKKSKDGSPKEENELGEKLAKNHKKKKREKLERNENVKVELMPEEMVPIINECEDDEEMDSPRDIDSGSDQEEYPMVSPEEEVKFKPPEKSEKHSPVKKKANKSKKKDLKKHNECEDDEEMDSPREIDSGSDNEESQAVSPEEEAKFKSKKKSEKYSLVKKKANKSKKKELKKHNECEDDEEMDSSKDIDSGSDNEESQVVSAEFKSPEKSEKHFSVKKKANKNKKKEVKKHNECEEDEEMDSPKNIDSGSDNEESEAVSLEEEAKFKSLEKSEKHFSVKKKANKNKKKEVKKHNECEDDEEMDSPKNIDSGSDNEESEAVSLEEEAKFKSLEKSEKHFSVKKKANKNKKKDLKKHNECEDDEQIDSPKNIDSGSKEEETQALSPEEEAKFKPPEKSEKHFPVKKKANKSKKKELKKQECEDDKEMASSKDIDSGSDNEESQAISAEEDVKFKSVEKSEKHFSVKKKADKSEKKELKKDKEKHSKDKSKKKCNATDKKKVRCKRFCMQEREIFDTGTWVQCTNSECLKWRFLHDVQDPITVPMLWTCDMNPDTKQNDCSHPESASNKDNEEFIYTKYTEGTVVWGRVDGYPWWPGMVEMDPDSMSYFDIETEDSMYPKYYHVVFFGKKVSRAWVAVSNIAAFTENKPPPTSKGMPRTRTQEFNAAEKLAVKALEVPINTRLKVFSFSSRYKGTWGDCSCHVCRQAASRAASSAADQESEENL